MAGQVMPDLTLFIDVNRALFVQSNTSQQPLINPKFVQGSNLSGVAQFLTSSGNGLAPYLDLDPTGGSLQVGLGYITATGSKALIALASTSATTSISATTGATAATGLAFTLNLATSAASAFVGAINSGQVWLEAGWSLSGAASAALNNAIVLGSIKTGFIGVGLPAPT